MRQLRVRLLSQKQANLPQANKFFVELAFRMKIGWGKRFSQHKKVLSKAPEIL
jgi:hypothetical protein